MAGTGLGMDLDLGLDTAMDFWEFDRLAYLPLLYRMSRLRRMDLPYDLPRAVLRPSVSGILEVRMRQRKRMTPRVTAADRNLTMLRVPMTVQGEVKRKHVLPMLLLLLRTAPRERCLQTVRVLNLE